MASFRCGKLSDVFRCAGFKVELRARDADDRRPYRVTLPSGVTGRAARRLQRAMLDAALEVMYTAPKPCGCCSFTRYRIRPDAVERVCSVCPEPKFVCGACGAVYDTIDGLDGYGCRAMDCPH